MPIFTHRNQDGDNLDQDVVFEDDGGEYNYNYEVSDNSFGDDDNDDGPVY